MGKRTDPTERAADDGRDLQGIATWEPRSIVDRLLARYTSAALRGAVVLFALLITGGILLLFLVQVIVEPARLAVVVLLPVSVVPALLLVAYVWYHDITTEPVLPVAVTYLLGIVLASFPFLINTLTGALLAPLREMGGIAALLFLVAQLLQFFVVVAPVEETVKLGAVFMYAYGKDDFDTVIDGAVYGAVAGLGFATIENASYIIGSIGGDAATPVDFLVQAGSITASRSFAGPGHVIWTALAGYYLGLAKFNREYALPLTVKGLLLAAGVHAVYNTTVTVLGVGLAVAFPASELLTRGVSLAVIFVFHLVVGGYLLVRLRRYRSTYAEVSPGPDPAPVSELDEDDDGTTGDDGSDAGGTDAGPDRASGSDGGGAGPDWPGGFESGGDREGDRDGD